MHLKCDLQPLSIGKMSCEGRSTVPLALCLGCLYFKTVSFSRGSERLTCLGCVIGIVMVSAFLGYNTLTSADLIKERHVRKAFARAGPLRVECSLQRPQPITQTRGTGAAHESHGHDR